MEEKQMNIEEIDVQIEKQKKWRIIFGVAISMAIIIGIVVIYFAIQLYKM